GNTVNTSKRVPWADEARMEHVEIYTIEGNSYGRPCYLPFMYRDQWFHSCTSTGREDGHLWCATTYNYDTDLRWGFCPVKDNSCETFWKTDSVTDSCYQFNMQATLSWSEARISCQQQGADLLSIGKLHEQTYINGILNSYSLALWIGLNDLDLSGGWQWSDSSPVKFLNWDQDQPSHAEEENCVVLRSESSGRWQNRDCSDALPYACKKRPNATLDPFTTDSWANDDKYECDVGWQSFQAGCYKLSSEKSKWNAAQKTCQKMDASLVSIHTIPELEFIIHHDQLWIGLHDTDMQMDFQWTDHTPVIFTYWHPFEPNNFRNTQEDCVSMWGPDGRWDDSPCNISLPFICKKPGTKSDGKPQHQECKQVLCFFFHYFPFGSDCCTVLEPMVTRTSSHLTLLKTKPPASALLTPLPDPIKFISSNDPHKKGPFMRSFQFSWSLCKMGKKREQVRQRCIGLRIAADLNNLMSTFRIMKKESEEHEQQWFWIGLNRRNPMDNGSWKWSDGLPLTYQNFGRYHYNNRQCAAADLGTMTWLAMHCDAALDWICKIPRGASSPKWIGFQEAEYKFFDHRTTWDQAKRICSWSGSSLASVHSAEEQAFLANILSKSEVDSWWLGLHTYENDGRFRWSDHSVLNYVSWALGRPQAVSRDRKCIHMSASKGDWADQKCHSDLPYVCKRVNVTGTVPPTPPSPHPPSGCPSGWSFYQHKVFLKCLEFRIIYSPRNTWSAAKLKCESQRGALALVSNHLDQAFITTLLKNVSADLWVGLTSDSKGHFRWAKTGLLSYTNWAPGEPVDNSGPHHNKTPGNCVVMIHGNPERKSGMWASRACEMENNGFICQKQPDRGLPPAPTLIPASLSKPVELGGVTYRVVQKRLDWTGALYLCESLNGTLAAVRDPYQQAYLTLLINSLRQPAWISLFNHGGRSFTWLGDEEVKYSNWKDRELNQMAGCGHMTSTGQWTMTPCDAKLDAAICQINEPISHQWIYPGLCPISVGEWAWVPFRNHCYAFNLQLLKLQQDALSSCKKMGAELLSILDEAENNFVWEHIQSYAEQAHGAWLGISMKGPESHNFLLPRT
uniref:Mannose receptor C-type 2 n=1 Tax=Fundulus heteroclitus TaxID=8078 RepID=A0A3Q2PGH8_FUNHE